jgi:hypothetical protein
LKKYCENDVRAMIAVEKYIKQEFIDKMPKQTTPYSTFKKTTQIDILT